MTAATTYDESDLASSSADLLRQLNLESEKDATSGLDLIKADALSLTKWVAGFVGAGGALTSLVTAFFASTVASDALKMVLVATAGLIIAVTIAVVGWVTVTDVRSRAQTQGARYGARSAVVHDYMDLVHQAHGWLVPKR